MGRGDRSGFNTPFADLKQRVKAARKAERKAERDGVGSGDGREAATRARNDGPAQGTPDVPGDRRPGTHPAPTRNPGPDDTPAPADDQALFERWVGGVEPLSGKGAARVRPKRDVPPPTRPVQPDEDAEVLATLSDLVAGEGSFDVSDSDEWVEGVAPGIDRRLLKRLKRGDFSVQAHLDLHGMIREEARTAVAAFIRSSRQIGRRCVLIVHGRGLGSPGGEPVLKNALVRWLSRGSLGQQVLAFATARPHDGGAGAVYVLLRR